MKKTIPQKLTAIMLSVLFIMLTLTSVIPYKAEESTIKSLSELMQIFPDGKYWNHLAKTGHGYSGYTHYGNNCGDVENTYTSTPCANHSGTASVGQYDCNSFDGAVQCAGFSRKLAQLAYGESQIKTNWNSTTNMSTAVQVIKPGDVLHYFASNTDEKNGHWVFVIGVSGSIITVGECNWGAERPKSNCLIKWGRSFDLKSATKLTLYRAPYALSGGAGNPSYDYLTIESDTYYLKNKSTGTYMTTDGTKDPSNVLVKAYSGDSIQKFVLDGSDKSYTLSPVFNTSIRLNPYSDTNGANVNIHSSQYESDNDQHWYFEPVSDGYIIHNAKNPSVVLGLDGDNVRLETRTGADDQIWILESATSSNPIVQDGEPCGENVYYVFDDQTGTLTIFGKGDMYDYGVMYTENGRNAPWYDKTDKIISVIIDEGVKSIGEDAFKRLINLKTVSLPSTLQRIGAYAFTSCISIEELTIPDNVITIGSFAFNNCVSLEKIRLSANVADYGAFLFDSCSDNLEITPETVIYSIKCADTDIEWKLDLKTGLLTFMGTGYISGTWVGPVSRNYYDGAPWLAFNKWIKNVVIGEGILGVDYMAFYLCDIESFTLPSSLEYFRSSGTNKNVDLGVIPPAVLKGNYDENVKWQIDKEKKELLIYGSGNFYGNSVWHDTPWNAFNNIINSVVVADGITALYDDGPGNTLSYNSVTLPISIERICENFFQNGELKTIYYKGTTEQWNAVEIKEDNDLLKIADIICLGDLYTVKFVDYNNTVISEKTYHYGDTVTVPDNPIRPNDSINSYTFKGWDKPITTVTGNQVYKAEYDATEIVIDDSEPGIVIEDAKASAGKEVKVKISLKNNPGIASLKLVVTYDPALTLTGIEYGGELGGMSQEPENYDSPVILNWFNGKANTYGDIVYATLTFTVSENAEAGKKLGITAVYDQEDLYNIDEENIFFAVSDGSVTVKTHTPGDINDDGSVNNKDVTALFKYLSGWDIVINEEAADINGDGNKNNKDITLLFKYLSGWDVVIH